MGATTATPEEKMDSHVRLLIWISLVVAATYLIWMMIRSGQWTRLQAEAAERQKNLIGQSTETEQVVRESIKSQEEQLRLTRELVEELKGLREETAERQRTLVTRSAEAEQGVKEIISLQEEQLRLTRELVLEIKGLREGLERRDA
jgi:TolA-binding protein